MKEEKVTEPAVETAKTEEMIPQSQVGGLIAKTKKEAIEDLLKDLGVEDVKSAKEGITRLKELQDAQKTEAEKLAEENARLSKERDEALTLVRQSKIERVLDEVLKELTIDTKYNKTILKLADLGELEDITNEIMKPIIEKVIEEELPMLINNDKIKIGAEKPEDTKVVSGAKEYLDKKYSNNPYYNKK